jgi:hypothetical protein
MVHEVNPAEMLCECRGCGGTGRVAVDDGVRPAWCTCPTEKQGLLVAAPGYSAEWTYGDAGWDPLVATTHAMSGDGPQAGYPDDEPAYWPKKVAR